MRRMSYWAAAGALLPVLASVLAVILGEYAAALVCGGLSGVSFSILSLRE
jgi:hypothetical protein